MRIKLSKEDVFIALFIVILYVSAIYLYVSGRLTELLTRANELQYIKLLAATALLAAFLGLITVIAIEFYEHLKGKKKNEDEEW